MSSVISRRPDALSPCADRRRYVVLSVDNRGTPAPKGAAWRKIVYGTVGDLSSKDQDAAIRTLAPGWLADQLRCRPERQAPDPAWHRHDSAPLSSDRPLLSRSSAARAPVTSDRHARPGTEPRALSVRDLVEERRPRTTCTDVEGTLCRNAEIEPRVECFRRGVVRDRPAAGRASRRFQLRGSHPPAHVSAPAARGFSPRPCSSRPADRQRPA